MMGASAFQIASGLGAGNIGDELMIRAFWRWLRPEIVLDVPLFPESARQREAYPAPHRYLAVDWYGNENAAANTPGLLVGATPVMEIEGLNWPLQFLAPRLRHFHERGLPVDAVGVGVDLLHGADAITLFREHFSMIRSWTVRSVYCRDALLSMGVQEDRVRVGADWAWLYQPQRDLTEWALDHWKGLGVDPEQPLLVANVVNMVWSNALEAKRNIASALDRAARKYGLQIAFFCNECRSGDFFDYEAACQLSELMTTAVTLVPNDYYSCDETVALLRGASVCVGQRYHFMIESVLAGVPPVGILRGQKMKGLAAELGFRVGGLIDCVDRDSLFAAIEEGVEKRTAVLAQMEKAKCELQSRAALNLSFLPELCRSA